MKFSIDIESGDAALTDDPHGELSRILLDVVKRLQDGQGDGTIRDINGNRVGEWWFESEDGDGDGEPHAYVIVDLEGTVVSAEYFDKADADRTCAEWIEDELRDEAEDIGEPFEDHKAFTAMNDPKYTVVPVDEHGERLS